jgi:hypothetical protein
MRISGLYMWGGDINRPSTSNSGSAIVQCVTDKVVAIDTFAIDRYKEIARVHRAAVDRQTRHNSIAIFAGGTQALG